MAAAIKKLDKLEVLNLGDCLLKFGGAKLICNALKGRHPNLKDLVLDSNEFRVPDASEEGNDDTNYGDSNGNSTDPKSLPFLLMLQPLTSIF